MINKRSVGKGAAYLYVEAIAMLFSGYLYWFILSIITSPSIVGISSTVISIVTIFAAVGSVGVSGGIQSFIGKNLVENNKEQITKHIDSSIIILTIGVVITVCIMFGMKEWLYYHFHLDFTLLTAAIIMMTVTVISAFFRALMIPSLNTKVITFSSILSTLVKIISTVILVLLDGGPLGILIGFTLYPLISSVILLISIKKTYYDQSRSKIKKKINANLNSISDIFFSGIGFWIPGIINTIGSQLGTVLVFLSNGSGMAGIYFIALSMVTGISVIVSVLSLVAYPTISSLKDGKKRATWHLLRLSLILTAPLSNCLIFYSAQIMQIFGHQYLEGSLNLSILLLSIFPLGITNGVGVLAYAYGDNRRFLFIGLATSIPRVLLYMILVPYLGANGAALTYSVGAIIGAIWALVIAKKMGLRLFWKQLIIIFLIPLLASAVLSILQINFILGILVGLIVSYIAYIRLDILNLEDIDDISKSLPPRVSNPLMNTIAKIYYGIRR